MFFQGQCSIMNAAFLAFLTSCSLWKTTTLPPLSPVANSSPDELNSTVEIMSAANTEKQSTEMVRTGRGGGKEMPVRGQSKKKAVKVSVRH